MILCEDGRYGPTFSATSPQGGSKLLITKNLKNYEIIGSFSNLTYQTNIISTRCCVDILLLLPPPQKGVNILNKKTLIVSVYASDSF